MQDVYRRSELRLRGRTQRAMRRRSHGHRIARRRRNAKLLSGGFRARMLSHVFGGDAGPEIVPGLPGKAEMMRASASARSWS